MKRFAALMMALPLVGCVQPQDDASEIRAAIPTADAVAVKVPGASGKPGDGAGGARDERITSAEQLGELATFYQFTRATSRDLNGGAGWVLLLVHTIVQFPVTTVEDDLYIWGPWTEALNPSEYRLTVTKDDDGSFLWSLEGRLKSEGAAAAFEAVVAGDAMPGDEPFRGSGAFTMDFAVAEKLDPAGNDGEGVISITYDLTGDPATVVMDYEHAEGTFHYTYAESVTDGSGDFTFAIHADLDDNGSALEDAEIRSRWLPTGAGRSDVVIMNGDAGTTIVQVSECWDATFGRTYYTDNLSWQPTEGEPTSCEIAEALFPVGF